MIKTTGRNQPAMPNKAKERQNERDRLVEEIIDFAEPYLDDEAIGDFVERLLEHLTEEKK